MKVDDYKKFAIVCEPCKHGLKMRLLPLPLYVSTLICIFIMLGGSARAFDTGHHWKISSQVLREFGFTDDARQTVCVSNWMLDYYSSSPTGSKRIREELRKLHCDNLHDAEAVKLCMETFMANSKHALISKTESHDIGKNRATLLLLGAVLHVVQDLYSHSNWPELKSDSTTFSAQTFFKTRGRVPPQLITGGYHPPEYVSDQMPHDHPEHGSY